DGKLYVFDELARLICLNAADGEQLWRFAYGRAARGSGVWADGKIYVGEVGSRFHILKPGADGCERLHAQPFLSRDGESQVEINGSPAVANGRIYFTTSE